MIRPSCWYQNFGPNWLSAPTLKLRLSFFSSTTADFNISLALRWAIQDQWSSGFYVEWFWSYLPLNPYFIYLLFPNKTEFIRFHLHHHYLSPVKRICVFEHSVMTNFNCACPAIQRGQGSGFLSEGSSWLTACMGEQRRFWRDCADAQARLNLRCSHRLTRSTWTYFHLNRVTSAG